MKEINEDLYALFNESVWFADLKHAEISFNELMELVIKETKMARKYEDYEDFEKCAQIDIPEIKKFANGLFIHLLSGLWQLKQTPKEVWMAAWMSTDKNTIVEETFTDCNILTVIVEDTGVQGGDAGHGGFVKLTLKNDSCTAMSINGVDSDLIEIQFSGDAERRTFYEALKVAVKTIEVKGI
jgi:hypothetical protein